MSLFYGHYTQGGRQEKANSYKIYMWTWAKHSIASITAFFCENEKPMGLALSAVSWFNSYLSQRSQVVGFNAVLSDALPAWCVETVTKQAKLSCQSFLKTGSFQCGAMDVKRFYEKHVLHKYGNYTDPSLSEF